MKCLLGAALLITPLAATAQHAGAGIQTQMRSNIDELRITGLQTLPPAPASADLPEYCAHWLVTPETAAGRRVAAAGWGVTGEVALGKYQAVSFVASLEPGTSGACPASDGNVGIFEGDRLVAIVYAPRGTPRTIGSIEPYEADGVRIWDGDYLRQPLADLRLAGDGALTVGPLAHEERLCGGKASVPNIYGKPITEARAALAEAGWVAVATADQSPWSSHERDLAARGLLEVESCAGTGFGFCLFNYEGPAGRLSVTTAGDDDAPAVAGYSVTCTN